MNRKIAFSASTALVLSLIMGMGSPAWSEKGDDGKLRHEEQKKIHAQKKEARQAAHVEKEQLRKQRDEVRATARLNEKSKRDVLRLQESQAREAKREQLNSQRVQDLQLRKTEQLQTRQTRDNLRLEKQKLKFDQKLSAQALQAKQREQRMEFAQQLALSKKTEQLRLDELRQQNRLAQYKLQQDYLNRLEQQRLSLLSARDFDFYGNPTYYTVPAYRYLRGGRYYETSQYGGTLLEQAVNYGCNQGFAAGVADRQDRFPFSMSGITSSYIYQDANYGYSGILVPRSDYNYYFRQGYKRCYRDGYYGRTSSANSILSTVLNSVLGLQMLR